MPMPDGADILKAPRHRAARAQHQRRQNVQAPPPTRYALALRRQAANRVRLAAGREPLANIGPGGCEACGGWGVAGSNRTRCPACGGTGG
jgi:hypothetical protein